MSRRNRHRAAKPSLYLPGIATKSRNKKVADLDKLAAANPNTDRDAVGAALKAIEAMRRMGIEGPDYRLASPYGHTQIHSKSETGWIS